MSLVSFLLKMKNAPVAVPDIENFSGDDTVLMVEFFKLMEEIGTFYHDRPFHHFLPPPDVLSRSSAQPQIGSLAL